MFVFIRGVDGIQATVIRNLGRKSEKGESLRGKEGKTSDTTPARFEVSVRVQKGKRRLVGAERTERPVRRRKGILIQGREVATKMGTWGRCG